MLQINTGIPRIYDRVLNSKKYVDLVPDVKNLILEQSKTLENGRIFMVFLPFTIISLFQKNL